MVITNVRYPDKKVQVVSLHAGLVPCVYRANFANFRSEGQAPALATLLPHTYTRIVRQLPSIQHFQPGDILPTPECPCVALAGFAFSQATNSLRSSAGSTRFSPTCGAPWPERDEA